MTNETKVSKMNEGKLAKQLNKVWRFDDGIMTMKEKLEKHEWSKRRHTIRNHSLKRIELEYKKTRDIHEYFLFYKGDDLHLGVNKMIYDYMNHLPEEVRDGRF